MENQQKKRFSQTVRRPISQCENSPTQIRNAKISQCEISQCQMPFRNANFNFAMRKFRNAKFRNAKCHFAMPILNLHCQFQFRNAKISQIQISQCENFAMRNFAMPRSISHCEIHCLCEIQFRKPFRIAKFTLRNLQALSSFVINAEPPSIFGVLLFCPIT